MSTPILQCCQQLSQGGYCDYSLPYFGKDVYDPDYYPVPAILMVILSVISLSVLFFALRNIKNIFALRHQIDIKNVLVMNTLISCAVLTLFIYALDGPIQLLSTTGDGFNPIVILILQVFTVGYFHYTLAYSSYTWTKLICMYKGKWGRNNLTKFIAMFLLVDLIYITLIIVINLIFPFINIGTAVQISYLGLSISTVINGLIFSLSCYVLATHLKEIYDFDARKQMKVRMLRVFALIIALLVLGRVGNDLYSYTDDNWQSRLKVISFCHKEPAGGLYIFLYMVFADILPQLLFLFLFSPTARQREQSVSQQEQEMDWPRYEYSEDDTPESLVDPFQN